MIAIILGKERKVIPEETKFYYFIFMHIFDILFL